MHYTQCCVLCSQKHHKKVFCFFFKKYWTKRQNRRRQVCEDLVIHFAKQATSVTISFSYLFATFALKLQYRIKEANIRHELFWKYCQFNSWSNCFFKLLLLSTRRRFNSHRNTKLTFHVLSWKTSNATRDGRIFLPLPRTGAAWSSAQMKCWGMCLCNLLNRISRPVPAFSAHSGRLTATSEHAAMIFNAYAACCSDKKNVTFYLRANFSSQESLNSAAAKCSHCLRSSFLSYYTEPCRLSTEGQTKDIIVRSVCCNNTIRKEISCFQVLRYLAPMYSITEKNLIDQGIFSINV